MKKQDCFYLGKITKLHGFKGDLEVYLDVDQPEQYSELDMFYLELNPGNPLLVPYFISEMQAKRNNRFKLTLEDIDSQEKAKLLVNKDIYLPQEELPELDESQFYFHEVEGFVVLDEDEGEIGRVSHIIDQGPNPLLVVKNGEKEILIPLHDKFLSLVNKEKKEIHISTPEGFYDLFE